MLITGGATANLLSGNFVGTSASGNSALGNRLDGVAIVNANGNQLIGCTFQQSPFVFYNVLSGNGGNGLRITNSNDTTIQANFLGVGANNATIVANGGDGLLVSGSSAEHAGRRRDPAGQRDLRQRPATASRCATRPAASSRSTRSPGSSPSRARRPTGRTAS